MIVHSSSIHCRYLKSVKETAKSGELENERHLGFFKGNGKQRIINYDETG